MKSTIRIVALIGAIMIVAALGVTAFAANGTDPTPAPATSVSPSDDPTPEPSASPSADGRIDISGNCDEAEHANDPECQGGVAAQDDNSGPGSGDDRMDGDDSGHGSDDSDHGNDDHGGDDQGDDDSGHGSDDSGHGSDDGDDD